MLTLLERIQCQLRGDLDLLPCSRAHEHQEASLLLRLDPPSYLLQAGERSEGTGEITGPFTPPNSVWLGGTIRGFNSDEVLTRAVRDTVWIMRDGNIRWLDVYAKNSDSLTRTFSQSFWDMVIGT